MSETQIYDRRTIVLHWLSAATIAALWLLGQTIDVFPSELHVWPRSAHIILGLLLIGLTVARIGWRLNGGRALPPADTGLLALAAKGGKLAIYLLIPLTLLLGLSLEAIRADNILDLGRLPSIAPGDRALRHLVSGWHALAANGLVILAGLHGAAAMWHHFVRRDGVLRRMMLRG
jgi:cytochrome b561